MTKKIKVMKNRTSIRELCDIAFKQVTELGSFMVYGIITVLFLFFDTTMFWKLLVSIVLIMIVGVVIKAAFFKDRPKKQAKNTLISRLDASSFPSIHAMRAYALAFWLAAYFNTLMLTIYLALIAIVVMYSRIYLKKHYWSDVIGGVVLSALIIAAIWYGWQSIDPLAIIAGGSR